MRSSARAVRLRAGLLIVMVMATLAAISGRVSGGEPVASALFASGLVSPTYVTHAPGDPARLFVLERAGRVRLVINGAVQAAPFLDISPLVSTAGEGGFLGIAFHPDYAINRTFYVHYTAPGLVTKIAEYRRSAGNPNIANPNAIKVLLSLAQPASNHNAGWIGFSPNDGYLYVPLGDGGGGGGRERAQDLTSQLLGKILRINPVGDGFPADATRNYSIPPDNPFVGIVGDDEIWALGLRNPYRASFDRVTGDLWIGDVGETNHEEIDFQPASSNGGENYGWGCMEGVACLGTACTCNAPGLTLPIVDYLHTSGNCVVTGGTVYRGCALPGLVGTYFFADYCSGRIYSFREQSGSITEFRNRTFELDPPSGTIDSIVAIGEDALGELYIVDLGGEIYKIVPSSQPADSESGGLAIPCEPGDVDGDGTVGFGDIAAILATWGPCAR